MRSVRPVGMLLCLWMTCATLNSPARADFLTPNGNPTGPSYADSPSYWWGYYRVELTQPAQWGAPEDDPDSLELLGPPLAAQGISRDNGWAITRFHVEGDIRLDFYQAWAETRPAFTQGAIDYPGGPAEGAGGAAIGLHYIPQGADPVGADVHWIQLILTNDPAPGAAAVQHPFSPDFYYYIDNVGNPAGNPFYDAGGGAADATDFLDVPSRPYNSGTRWYAYLFLATGDLNAQTLSISGEAVHWGFIDPVVTASAPEPSGLVLTLLGSSFLLLVFRQKRSKYEGKPFSGVSSVPSLGQSASSLLRDF